MFAVEMSKKRFRAVLDRLDEIRDAAAVQEENLDEMNAEFEDALFVIECIGAEDDDWQEALGDALEEFRDLAHGYRQIALAIPALGEVIDELEAAVDAAEKYL